MVTHKSHPGGGMEAMGDSESPMAFSFLKAIGV
jgi:hypothetical protein